MFKIKDVNFPSDDYGMESYLSNWPMVYILENGKKAYVGQTNSIIKRMMQHKEVPEKKEFTKAHFIYSDRFNQSATFDYESQLISLMAADRQFILTNRNAGLKGLEYFDKESYDKDFKLLWQELQKKQLVKNTIEELQQSDIFKYSPYKALNDEQKNIVSEIISNLKLSLDRRIVVGGMPGSGKTIVAVYLFKLLRESPEFNGLKIGMVVPPESLRGTMQDVFNSVNNLSAKDVIGPTDVTKEKYDILIVDEAHRLKKRKNLTNYTTYDAACERIGLTNEATQLDWILSQSKCSILFYDKNQIVFPAGINVIEALQNNGHYSRMMAYYTLYNQLRCQGGMEYLEDIKALIHGKINHKLQPYNYELRIVEDFKTFNDLYKEREAKYGLTRMIAGFAWEWKSRRDRNAIDINIDGIKLQWNSEIKNWVHSNNAVNEVGCIHSTQGYDLNYGFVILGEDIKYDNTNHCVYVDREKYCDKYGKYNSTDEELDEYIKNVYFVLMSRGIKGTYLYICDNNLREYFKKYIDTIKKV